MALTRLSAIDGETILPLDDAKDHLRVRHSDEDTLIASLRNAACEYVGIHGTTVTYRKVRDALLNDARAKLSR